MKKQLFYFFVALLTLVGLSTQVFGQYRSYTAQMMPPMMMGGPGEFDPLDMVGGADGLYAKIAGTDEDKWGSAAAMEENFETFAEYAFNNNLTTVKKLRKDSQAAPFLAVVKQVLKIPVSQFANMVREAGRHLVREKIREQVEGKLASAREDAETREEVAAIFSEIKNIISNAPKSLKNDFKYALNQQKQIERSLSYREEDEKRNQEMAAFDEQRFAMERQGQEFAQNRMKEEMNRGKEMMEKMAQGGQGGGFGGPGGGPMGGPMGMGGPMMGFGPRGPMGPGGQGGFGMAGDHFGGPGGPMGFGRGPEGGPMPFMQGGFPGYGPEGFNPETMKQYMPAGMPPGGYPTGPYDPAAFQFGPTGAVAPIIPPLQPPAPAPTPSANSLDAFFTLISKLIDGRR